MFALQCGEDMPVVLEVVADDERGAVFAAASATDSLARAEGFDGDAVAKDDGIAAPDGASADGFGKVLGESVVVEEFGFDVFEVGQAWCLVSETIQRYGFGTFDGGSQRQGQGAEGGFGAAARAEHVDFGSADVLCGVELLGEPAVHVRRREAKVVGEIVAAPIQQVQGAGRSTIESAEVAVFLLRWRRIRYSRRLADVFWKAAVRFS